MNYPAARYGELIRMRLKYGKDSSAVQTVNFAVMAPLPLSLFLDLSLLNFGDKKRQGISVKI
jgi:hypothetical protein